MTRCRVLADFVAEVGDCRSVAADAIFLNQSVAIRSTGSGDAVAATPAFVYARHTSAAGGGLTISLASRRRFWAMAANVNSN